MARTSPQSRLALRYGDSQGERAWKKTTRVVFVARGSSHNAAIYGRYLTEILIGLPASIAAPSVHTLASANVFGPGTLVVGLSQSDSSPDICDTLEAARASGSITIAFTNDAASRLDQLADIHVPLEAGEEMSVAATKTYTAELIALGTAARVGDI